MAPSKANAQLGWAYGPRLFAFKTDSPDPSPGQLKYSGLSHQNRLTPRQAFGESPTIS